QSTTPTHKAQITARYCNIGRTASRREFVTTRNFTIPEGKKLITGHGSAFGRYPAAVRAGALLFTSGQRGATEKGGFEGLPPEGRRKEQGFGAVDDSEGRVAVSAWNAHAELEA